MSQREGQTMVEAVVPPWPPVSPLLATNLSHSPQQSSSADVFATSSESPSSSFDLSSRKSLSLPAGTSQADAPSRLLLQQVFADGLAASPLCDPVAVNDLSLDEYQRDAVARAVACSDLFVIHGPTGTGKSRTVVEIIRQFVARGERVLFLSPEVSQLDALLPTLSQTVSLVRRLAPTESPDQLPSDLRALNLSGRQDAIRTSLNKQASDSLSVAEARLRQAESRLQSGDDLDLIRGKIEKHTAERAALEQRLHSLPEEIQREAESGLEPAAYYVQRLRGSIASHARRIGLLDADHAEWTATKTEALHRQKTAETDCNHLRPQAEAVEQGRWYSLTYWKARGDTTLSSRLVQAQARLTAATASLEELALREQKLAVDCRKAEEDFAAERSRMTESEVAQRAAELSERLRAIAAEGPADENRERELSSRFSVPKGGRSALLAEVGAAREHAEAARAKLVDVTTRLEELVREETQKILVVAGSSTDIAADLELSNSPAFDAVVIDDAHRLSENDFHAAAHLAKKWILLGQPCEKLSGRQRTARPEPFARLADSLPHGVWVREGSRLICRLSAVRGPDRRRLECEPVADAPDIELRLFNPPDGTPTLAEVVFPDRIEAAAAREYVFRELGEVTCQPRTRSANWETTPTGIVARFGPANPESKLAPVGPGVHEELSDLETRAIHFGPEWSLEQAREWTAENVARRDPGRLSTLCKSYRTCPGLSHWLNRAFDTGFTLVPITDQTPHVEFLAVPDLDPRRRREPQGRPTRTGGAGYEIDLGDPRQRAALPADLQDLPNSGFVNVPEAQALIRYLEAHPTAGLAITSPFPTQVAVLRNLVGRSARLSRIPVLDSAEAARHECDLLAVSLTRSHVARAVTYGETPAILAGLLCRARKKLLLAGDPGTLARRLQWEGPVDHLDATEAARERDWVAALADCPRVTHPRQRQFAENSRT